LSSNSKKRLRSAPSSAAAEAVASTAVTPSSPQRATTTKTSSSERRAKGVTFGEVAVQSFELVQARDKIPDDGHAAALGLGEAVGSGLTRRVSAFERQRQDVRSPAKVYGVTRKLSFNTRREMLVATASALSADAGLKRKKSIIEFGKEVSTITKSRARSGCSCAGPQCNKQKCVCFKEQIACVWDLCACECKDCTNPTTV
jgi:hypothetical protein